jgi:cytochrome c oxidase subunit IV
MTSEANTAEFPGYGIYWRTWGFLLLLTTIMFVLDTLTMPRLLLVLLMVSAMLLKVALIAGIFMHLRQESLDLVIAIGVCVLGCGGILYALTVVDAWRIAHGLGVG